MFLFCPHYRVYKVTKVWDLTYCILFYFYTIKDNRVESVFPYSLIEFFFSQPKFKMKTTSDSHNLQLSTTNRSPQTLTAILKTSHQIWLSRKIRRMSIKFHRPQPKICGISKATKRDWSCQRFDRCRTKFSSTIATTLKQSQKKAKPIPLQVFPYSCPGNTMLKF